MTENMQANVVQSPNTMLEGERQSAARTPRTKAFALLGGLCAVLPKKVRDFFNITLPKFQPKNPPRNDKCYNKGYKIEIISYINITMLS